MSPECCAQLALALAARAGSGYARLRVAIASSDGWSSAAHLTRGASSWICSRQYSDTSSAEREEGEQGSTHLVVLAARLQIRSARHGTEHVISARRRRVLAMTQE